MIVVDASVAIKWFVAGEPLVDEAERVLGEIQEDPSSYVVPDPTRFMPSASTRARCARRGSGRKQRLGGLLGER